MTKVVYPGSFNPITFGHENIVERGLQIFDHVVVAIGTSADKNPDMVLKDRIELCRAALAGFGDRVSVEGFNTLLVEFVHTHDTNFVLRGLRTVMDYDYEFQMLEMNQAMDPAIEYVLLPTAAKWSHVSSTRVREIASYGGDISAFVAPCVVEYYRNKRKS